MGRSFVVIVACCCSLFPVVNINFHRRLIGQRMGRRSLQNNEEALRLGGDSLTIGTANENNDSLDGSDITSKYLHLMAYCSRNQIRTPSHT